MKSYAEYNGLKGHRARVHMRENAIHGDIFCGLQMKNQIPRKEKHLYFVSVGLKRGLVSFINTNEFYFSFSQLKYCVLNNESVDLMLILRLNEFIENI